MSLNLKVKTSGTFQSDVFNDLNQKIYSETQTNSAENSGSINDLGEKELINKLIETNKFEIATTGNPQPDTMPDNNALLIVMDQMVSYKLLPEYVLNLLPGYQAFKKIGIEFTNNYNNRSTCTPSRAVIITGKIDTQLQDSMNSKYQSDIIPCINFNYDTLGKAFKANNYETRHIGKSHLDSRVYSNKPPNYSTNTSGTMRSYGYDINDKWGEFDPVAKGLLADVISMQFIESTTDEQYDYYDPLTSTKQSGVIPYLRKCKELSRRFLCHVNLTNPHDTQESRSNLAQKTIQNYSSQFFFPFCEEQCEELKIKNPYVFDENFTDAFIKNKSLVNNFFEKNYFDYKNIVNSLHNVPSYLYDYQTEPKYNSAVPYNIGGFNYYKNFCTTPVDSSDIKSWKNFLNNYYCLVIEADSHVYRIYQELEKLDLLRKTNVIITADHGEMMDAHGLRCKGFIYNECINIPLLVASPNLDISIRNTKSDYLCSSIDLIPTLINLSKITYKSDQFTGESVFDTNSNGKLIPKNKLNYPNKSVVTFVGGNDSFPLYIYYKNWQTTTGNVENLPANVAEFGFIHTGVQVYLNNKQYKYGKYFSLKDLLTYNTTKYNITFTKQELIDNAYNDQQEGAIKFSLKDFNVPVFTFEEVYNYVFNNLISKGSDTDSIFLMSIVSSVMKITDNKTNRLYYIPGCFDDFIYNNKNYLLFCYNMTDDKDEVANLLDKKRYDSKYDALFKQLNSILNSSIESNKLNPMYIILPYQQLNDIIENIQEAAISGIIDYFALTSLTNTTLLANDATTYIMNDN
jgi:arylsulfatase A-like enzyme